MRTPMITNQAESCAYLSKERQGLGQHLSQVQPRTGDEYAESDTNQKEHPEMAMGVGSSHPFS